MIPALAGAHDLPAASMRCEPAIPFYCANIHVGCAGRSNRPTVGFDVVVSRGGAEVIFDDGQRWPATSAGSRSGLVLRPQEGRDWIRVEEDGRFSQRMYDGSTPLMSRGRCTTNPAA